MFNDVASTTEGHLMPPHVKLFVRDYVDGGRVPLTNRDAKSRFTISASQHDSFIILCTEMPQHTQFSLQSTAHTLRHPHRHIG